MEFILQLFGLLCVGVFWAVTMLAWLIYVWKGKPPKSLRYIGKRVTL